MAEKELVPEEVYNGILIFVREREPALADRIEELVNEGKEVSIPRISEERKKKPEFLRKREPLTAQEATAAALDVLEAHFVEFPAVLARAQQLIDPDAGTIITFEREPAQSLTKLDEPVHVPELPSEGERLFQKDAMKRLRLLALEDR